MLFMKFYNFFTHHLIGEGNNVNWSQWRTFVEVIGGDESFQHQLKRQDRVNFWGAQLA